MSKFKKGDRVLVKSYKETGTVSHVYERSDSLTTVVVIPDNTQKFAEAMFPIEKINTQPPPDPDEEVSVSIHTSPEDLELLGQTKIGSDWKDIWDSNE